MVATNSRTVTVFGGTGFLGRRIVQHLRYRGFPVRVASRHPDLGIRLFDSDDPQLQSVRANIHDERSVADALAGAYGAINAVSLYVEHGQETFHSVHVESAQRVAAQAHRARVERFVHVSGIGADTASQSHYIRKRGEGELAVQAAFTSALFVRPAVMFGPDDAFLTTILKLLRQLPIYPMFGRGLTRLQPAYVEDVAEAIGRVMQHAETPSMIFELGGPHVYSYKELLGAIARQAGLAPLDSDPVCRLACTRMGFRNVSESTPHSQSSGTDAELLNNDHGQGTFAVVLEIGDETTACLQEFVCSNKITVARLTGIGAFAEAVNRRLGHVAGRMSSNVLKEIEKASSEWVTIGAGVDPTPARVCQLRQGIVAHSSRGQVQRRLTPEIARRGYST